MTITTRSKRVSPFDVTLTPAAVGPGAYAPEKSVTSFKSEMRPLYSGFAASEKRDLNANKTTSATTPGPGAYIATSGQPDSPTATSNVFATKISRFAPSAPGSTIYRPSSIQDNPGPGAYTIDPTPPRPKSSPRHVTSNQHEPIQYRASVPTIPTKAQSFGYVNDPVNGDLKLQPQSATVYSGIGQDTVGPAAYNSHATIWNEKKNVAPSLRSTVKREVWEDATTPRRAFPGPGQYDPAAAGRRRTQAKPSAVFASRVPILPNPKRTEHYDPERELELLAKDQRYQPRAKPMSKVEAFGSTSQRTDLANQISAPFSSPSFTATPGPGMYAARSPSNFASFHGGNLKRSTHHARGSSYRDGHHIGFTSATERHCLSKAKPSSSPGPGAYKSETPRTVERAIKSKSTVGRFGVFGSTSERHVWECLETAERDELTPGPGAYDHSVDPTGGHFPMLVNSAAFKSSSSRFAKRSNPHAPPHVQCVGDTTAPAVGQYNLSSLLRGGGDGGGGGVAGEDTTQPPPTQLHSPRTPFLSTAERSVFDAKEATLLPGPGQYADEGQAGPRPQVLTRSLGVRATLSNEERFRVTPRVPDHVGPGAYSIQGTVGTRSFNVTMTPKR